ncbi:hypothetical protein BOX15_Mlig022562g3 [Macrostomum lignano]|uniref:Bystin n=1 Tax=Macrostomum lignano TaxID=282301 RepID=A0A267EG29_9PLAT|nr:hypothetical protein BOX15_Mlig022562g3 [Macrostomum lignano]
MKKKNQLKSTNRPSLADDIAQQDQPSQKSGRKRKLNEDDGPVSIKYVDSKLSQKILKVAQEQLAETRLQPQSKRTTKSARGGASASARKFASTGRRQRDEADSDSEDSDGEDDDSEESDSDGAHNADEGDAGEAVDASAELANQLYTDEGGPLGQLDAEQLRSLIAEKRTEIDEELVSGVGGGSEAGASRVSSCLPDSVREHFESCRAVLSQYRSGKLPKPVKQLPHFSQWQELVELLDPNSWTAAAMCAVTKYFAAKGKTQALQFFQGYLLPRCRDDIAEYRRLNFHLYSALRKALFRQREFFCGLLLPWARESISLPEATIIGGLLRRVSIPVKYAAPALHMLLQLPYSGGRAILIRVLLEKKYNLPDPVLGQALAHFVAMETDSADHLNEDGRLPVLWHQALLALVERYGDYLSGDERQRLLRLCRQHQHPEITPAVRQALGALQQRDARMETAD